jgi:L-ascorbate metabolism protein UlaG (beta-lactamase superfamily)
MVISYHGVQSFKISQGELTLVFNPRSKTSADITLFSVGRDETAEKSGFIIDGPGEYEIKDIFVKGFLSESSDKKINTIYLVSFEGINICFLGALSNTALSTETVEAIEDIDILFVPVGQETLDPASAYKLAVSLEPSVIIPMHYTDTTLKQFIKEGGEDKVETLDKFVVKKKDLEGKKSEILVLKEE